MFKSRKAIIIQARMGSTRLPGKVLADFYNGQTILEIIIKKCVSADNDLSVIVATSDLKEDDPINFICRKMSIACFRGSSTDVLNRLILAAKKYNINDIIRICADNPFLDNSFLQQLIKVDMEDFDYCSFKVNNGLPAIKSHWGFFGERVKLDTLIKVVGQTDEAIFHEHVTNFIYNNPSMFKLKWINAPDEIVTENGLRFTIDDEVDFNLMRIIYSSLENQNKCYNYSNALSLVNNNSQWKLIMKRQIEKYSK